MRANNDRAGGAGTVVEGDMEGGCEDAAWETGEATPQPHRHTNRRINPPCLRPSPEKRKDEQRHGAGDVAVEGEDADGGEVGDFAPARGVVDGGPGVGLEGLGDVDVEPVDVEGEVDEEEEQGHDEEAQEAGGVEGLRAED
ncbi:hypothetical protein V500_06072 [Pseudogymnoascus sp. VKM F-4518 (FW-2643)]|nr:hypothetical protein V500_06072 [Pseudogymnoascus sp. VKM F-4518 (FW-2643)]